MLGSIRRQVGDDILVVAGHCRPNIIDVSHVAGHESFAVIGTSSIRVVFFSFLCRTRCPPSWNTYIARASMAAPSFGIQLSSLMSCGMVLHPTHFITVWEALAAYSGFDDWKIKVL